MVVREHVPKTQPDQVRHFLARGDWLILPIRAHLFERRFGFGRQFGIIRLALAPRDRKSTRLNSSHGYISYAVFCLKKKKEKNVDPYSMPPRHNAHAVRPRTALTLAGYTARSQAKRPR